MGLWKIGRKPTPKFCPKCGSPLTLRWLNIGFDSQTGHQDQEHVLVCPVVTDRAHPEGHFCAWRRVLDDNSYEVPKEMGGFR
jgi:hypothetical protein